MATAIYGRDTFQGPDGQTIWVPPRRNLDGGGADCLAHGVWFYVDKPFTGSLGYLQTIDNTLQWSAPRSTAEWQTAVVHDVPGIGDLGTNDYSVSTRFRVNESYLLNPDDGGYLSWIAPVSRFEYRDDRSTEHPFANGETGYTFQVTPIPAYPGFESGWDVWLQTTFYYNYTNLAGAANSYRPIGGVDFSVAHTARLCTIGRYLCGYIDGELVTWVKDPYEDPASRHDSGGYPGLQMYDGHGYVFNNPNAMVGGTIIVEDWWVSGDANGAPDCGQLPPPGGGGGGGGGTAGLVWPMGKGSWRPVPLPIDTATSRVRPYGRGAPRGSRVTGVFAQGAWRTPHVGAAVDDGTIHGSPGDTLPDSGCGEVAIPTTTPDPFVGNRLFFCTELPISSPPDVLETSILAAGSWITGMLATAQATGRRIMLAQGGYEKFWGMTDGKLLKIDAWVAGLSVYEPLWAPYMAAGVLVGVQPIDDWYWPPAWGGAIIDTDEVNRICGVWKSYFPGIRTFPRGAPSFLLNYPSPGAGGDVSNIDVAFTQYAMRFGDVTAWKNSELAIRATLGIPGMLWSVNWSRGGAGTDGQTTGQPMTAAQFLTAGSVLAAESDSEGMGGWKYDLAVFNQAGFIDALTEVRNIMVAVP